MYAIATSKSFHNYVDAELIFKPTQVKDNVNTKHITFQERELSYRIYPHFHPYVKQLMRRLLQDSTSGLLAVDTEYAPDGAALPGSIEISLDSNTTLEVPGGSQVRLLKETYATLPSGGPILLAEKLQLKIAKKLPATFPGGIDLRLVDEIPIPGKTFNLSRNQEATVYNDARLTFSANAEVMLPDDVAIIPAGTEAAIQSGTGLTIPSGTQVTITRSKSKPKELYEDIFSNSGYVPSTLVHRPYPVKDLDFTYSGAYSVYNWELFFHVPFTIAIHLSKNQRFAEAQRWFHYIFDPTDNSDGPTPERFWKVRPFQYTDVKKIEEILENLASGADPILRDETARSIDAWMNAPFRPHVIARFRQQAYMFKTVMAYLDNLISWGDSLFRQDTGESIDEALMLYVLCANILGPRPLPVPKKGAIRPKTYSNLRADLDKFGNILRDVEADFGFDLMPLPAQVSTENERMMVLSSIGKALYFCVPRNDNMLTYWDTVADRLFKIRNSLNIQGIFRQLPLFEPPIDPALLARATAAGLDVGAIVSGLRQPLPLVRFQILVQKAAEICQEVKSLGNNLLSAMEKEDNEALSILRAKHERAILEMVEQVRYAQWQEAIKSEEGLHKSLSLAVQSYTFYERQLGRNLDDIKKSIPELTELDIDGLNKMKFDMNEPEVSLREITIDIAQGGAGSINDVTFGLLGSEDITGGKKLNPHEAKELDDLELAHELPKVAKSLQLAAKGLSYIPDFPINLHFWGLGGTIIMGGTKLADATNFAAEAVLAEANDRTYGANRESKMGNYTQREKDWAFQSNRAAGEITQIFKQLRAAQIRDAVAEWELKNHQKQIKNAQEIEYFLSGELENVKPENNWAKKTTKKDFYAWMKRDVRGLYGQCFQFAFDIAKKAERALQHELGNTELSYLQFGYLAGKDGLLAGEKLYLDIKRMEMAYLDLNQREFELTKHISLLQVDPLALIQLRKTGRCTVKLPEELFDMDGPGHYFRRIKTVAVSIPCVTGPYASVNCTLTLLKSSIRITPVIDGNYARNKHEEDSHFSDYFGSLQSIVTSSAQNDSGMFDANLRDERYLPFEYSGVISEWQLELPADPSKGEPCQFDYDTISDVILHMRYTARGGGGLLRKGAMDNLKTLIGGADTPISVRMFSIRHEFPMEWGRFQSQEPKDDQRYELELNLRPEHYPFWSQGRLNSVKRVDIFADSSNPSLDVYGTVKRSNETSKESLAKAQSFGNLLVGTLSNQATGIELPDNPVCKFNFFFNDRNIRDLWITVTWSSSEGEH
jgi:hypothetical protein